MAANPSGETNRKPLDNEKIDAYSKLDELVIFSPRGHIASRVVVSATLFFDRGGETEKRIVAHEALMEYAEQFSTELSHHQYPGSSSRPMKIKWDELRDKGQEKILNMPAKEALDVAVFGQPFNTQTGGIGLFGGSISASGPDELMSVDLSVLEFCVASSWAAREGFTNFIGLVQKLTSILKPRHGIAGFGVQFDRIYESTSSRAYSFPFTKRFPGAHCGINSRYLTELNTSKADKDSIFTTNWLTIICDDIVKKMGGTDELRQKVGSSCLIHDYNGGTILQAGDYPQLGDVNRGLVLDDYRRVGQELKAARFENYRLGIFDVESPLDSLEETLKWIRRFD